MSTTHNPLSISGKTILVTGASSGIGRQCAIDFAKAGANVILFGRNKENLEATKIQCLESEIRCEAYVCDITDTKMIEQMVNQAVLQTGPIDGLLYSAGIEKTLPFNKLKSVDYQDIYAVNVIGGLNLIGILSKKKYRGENPKYVLISSITSVVGRPGVAAYAASKGALISAIKTVALELAPKGMTINCISPGTILTPMMENMLNTMTEEQRAERMAGFPLGLGKPEDISATALFLLSEGARWITGQNIVVDGGYTSR